MARRRLPHGDAQRLALRLLRRRPMTEAEMRKHLGSSAWRTLQRLVQDGLAERDESQRPFVYRRRASMEGEVITWRGRRYVLVPLDEE